MARPLRIQFPGGVYHVTARGDRRESIFLDGRDRERLIGILAQALARFDATMLAYCLMGNHYHFVLQTRRDNLSRLMRHVNGVYAQAFNRRHDLVGHLFQGRFTSIHVDSDAYLLEVCRYTELNPVRAGIAGSPADWPWSSYGAHCGLERSPPWLGTSTLHGQLLGRDASSKTDRMIAETRYAQFVAAGQGASLWDRGLRQSIYLGDDLFIERVQRGGRTDDLSAVEIPRVQRRKSTRGLRQAVACRSRNESVRRAYLEDGLTMSEIARAVGLSVSRISRLIRQPSEADSDDSREELLPLRTAVGRGQKARPDPKRKAKGKT